MKEETAKPISSEKEPSQLRSGRACVRLSDSLPPATQAGHATRQPRGGCGGGEWRAGPQLESPSRPCGPRARPGVLSWDGPVPRAPTAAWPCCCPSIRSPTESLLFFPVACLDLWGRNYKSGCCPPHSTHAEPHSPPDSVSPRKPGGRSTRGQTGGAVRLVFPADRGPDRGGGCRASRTPRRRSWS